MHQTRKSNTGNSAVLALQLVQGWLAHSSAVVTHIGYSTALSFLPLVVGLIAWSVYAVTRRDPHEVRSTHGRRLLVQRGDQRLFVLLQLG